MLLLQLGELLLGVASRQPLEQIVLPWLADDESVGGHAAAKRGEPPDLPAERQVGDHTLDVVLAGEDPGGDEVVGGGASLGDRRLEDCCLRVIAVEDAVLLVEDCLEVPRHRVVEHGAPVRVVGVAGTHKSRDLGEAEQASKRP